MILEVCVDSVESAVNAEKGGMLKILKQLVSVPVYVMIRPRGGDFLYSEQELAVMTEDIGALKAAGADGFVLGALTSDGAVDEDICQELIALDMCRDLSACLEQIIRLGCERVLTSGGENSALEGSATIRRLAEQAGRRIVVMPGAGISDRNIRRLLEETGCREIHASVRASRPSAMGHVNPHVSMGARYGPAEYTQRVTDRDLVSRLIQTAQGAA